MITKIVAGIVKLSIFSFALSHLKSLVEFAIMKSQKRLGISYTPSVKRSKLQRLTSSFENLSMKDNETFDEFYAKLSDNVNSSFNLGEKNIEIQDCGKNFEVLAQSVTPPK